MSTERIDVLARFECNHTPVPESGCWLWHGDYARKGYGRMRIGGNRSVRTHRLSYELHIGHIPPGLCVCHKCDTPQCVNPSHLFLGTSQENTADRVRKGRSRGGVSGARNPHRHERCLTRHEASAVLWLCAMDCRQVEVARYFGVSQGSVSAVVASALSRIQGAKL